MPFVRIELLRGRTFEQKKKAAELITDALVQTMVVPPEDIRILYKEFELEDFSRGGKLFKKEE